MIPWSDITLVRFLSKFSLLSLWFKKPKSKMKEVHRKILIRNFQISSLNNENPRLFPASIWSVSLIPGSDTTFVRFLSKNSHCLADLFYILDNYCGRSVHPIPVICQSLSGVIKKLWKKVHNQIEFFEDFVVWKIFWLTTWNEVLKLHYS